jgi:hypothetical protein
MPFFCGRFSELVYKRQPLGQGFTRDPDSDGAIGREAQTVDKTVTIRAFIMMAGFTGGKPAARAA